MAPFCMLLVGSSGGYTQCCVLASLVKMAKSWPDLGRHGPSRSVSKRLATWCDLIGELL